MFVSAPSPVHCVGKADVIFVLDSSESIGQLKYRQSLAFLANLAGSFKIGVHHFRFGHVIFSDWAKTVFSLNTFDNHLEILAALMSSEYMQRGTSTENGLKQALDLALANMRYHVPTVVILITDGYSANFVSTTLQAMLLQSYGVHVMAVGVGDKIRDAELQSIASRPSYVFRTDDFFTIETVLGKVAHRICKTTGGKEILVPTILPTRPSTSVSTSRPWSTHPTSTTTPTSRTSTTTKPTTCM
uniref:VWFA domain-containing protein n=1 Tax=Biomphalaria glabrata TaxID=6526 RepID=A0A2C9JXJ5_BIOGL